MSLYFRRKFLRTFANSRDFDKDLKIFVIEKIAPHTMQKIPTRGKHLDLEAREQNLHVILVRKLRNILK